MKEEPIETVFKYYIAQGGIVTNIRQFQMILSHWLSKIGQDFQKVYLFVLNQS